MSAVIRWEPFRELAGIRNRLDRWFTEGPRWTDEGLTEALWNPPVDVYETPESIVLKADLPGMAEKDVDISVEGNTLTIKGQREKETEQEGKNYYRVERAYGTFARSFTLPPAIDPNRIEANFSQGVLQVNLAKREETKPRQIKVKVQSDGE